ncbi:iron(III) transport system ATP-binding protein [Rhodoglobus vestalii]|uniref:ABC-type quaternary amine transporter n=1 Tax=Rhodoglobus vestalii TaxID=193384 RepID=A0A8H2K831_9MICO|nr:ABC transporter ATP-binding protein [Rhodoglobus vestalii]TQO20885.1 iron(III) transport system ATP-binding protein [Rhodoglobus vestalii]
MSSIALDSVGLRFADGTRGLDNIDLTIADGEFVALVGPSGSGKTTLLRTIAGFIAPTNGGIRIGGELVAGDKTFVQPEHRRLGMVFQQHAIWPHWDVAGNVGYSLKLAKQPRAARAARVAEVLELVGLAGMEKRNPATLSGGQRQRVALARALATAPRALLLDEALSALDEPLRARLRLELRTLTRAMGLTVVHVTHDRDEALALADRVVVLDHGRIQQAGTPEQLVTEPSQPFVARFLSDATVIPGKIVDQCFTAAAHVLRLSSDEIDGNHVNGCGSIAILPGDIRLHPAAGAGPHGIVVSSLFGREGSDVVVCWDGIDFRCLVPGRRPAVGEKFSIEIAHALYYPDDTTRSSERPSAELSVSPRAEESETMAKEPMQKRAR